MSGRFTSRPTCSPSPVVVAIPTTWRARSLDLPSPAPEVAEYIAIKGERAKR
jgi:hypothetical protein